MDSIGFITHHEIPSGLPKRQRMHILTAQKSAVNRH